MSSVLWWGRSDRNYSRNRIVLDLLADLGLKVSFFHPAASRLGQLEAFFHRLKRPEMIWVPCFRHRDTLSARFWASRWSVPLIIDPLISAYQKEVFEREKWSEDSGKAEKRRRWEKELFSGADFVIADTPAHANFFQKKLGVSEDRLHVLYVGAEEGIFRPLPEPAPRGPFEILFYGSFLQLQGAGVIVEAARMTSNPDLRWVLLGEGDMKKSMEEKARNLKNVIFENWIDYNRLPDRMEKAHVTLGIFGNTVKADLVIPNKMFQAMACGRPVITRRSKAYPEELSGSDVIGWVPAGDPRALAVIVEKWFSDPSSLPDRGKKTRRLFEAHFREEKLRGMLGKILEKVLSE